MLNIPDSIKQALQNGSYKEFVVHFPNGEHEDITNENIVAESLSFTESICSQSELKFGLCETPYIEFETFGIGKIKGYTIECAIKVNNYSIPLGTFVIDSCKKQADMTHRKIVAYGINAIPNISDSDVMKTKISSTSKTSFSSDIVKRILTYLNDIEMLSFTRTEETLTQHTYLLGIQNISINGITYNIGYTVKYYEASVKGQDKLYYVSGDNLEYTRKQMLNTLYDDITALITEKGGVVPLWLYKSLQYMLERRYCTFFSSNTVNEYMASEKTNLLLYPYISQGTSEVETVEIYYSFKMHLQRKSDNHYFYGTERIARPADSIKLYSLNNSLFGKFKQTETKAKDSYGKYYWNNTTSYDDIVKYVRAFIELQGLIGKTTRDGNFLLFNLKNRFSGLYPSETLYPSNDLYPSAVVGDTLNRSLYQTIWYDDDYTLPIGAVTCTFNNGTENICIKTYASGYSESTPTDTYATYDLSNNELIKSGTISNTDMTAILNTFIANASGISYMPAEVTMKGRPDIEAGDVLEISTSDETITTLALRRNMQGIQNIVDSIYSD